MEISRLKQNGIKSRRYEQNYEVTKEGKKIPIKPKTREPLIAMSVADLKQFFNLTQLTSLQHQAKVLGVVNSYVTREVKRDNNEELNDVIGCRLMMYYNPILELVPNDLPKQIVFTLLAKQGGLKEGDAKTLENVKEAFKYMYANLFRVESVTDEINIEQFQEFKNLSGLSVSDFISVFSEGEIPDEFEHIQVVSLTVLLNRRITLENNKVLESDKTFRLWLAWGLHLGLIDKQSIIDKLNNLSMDNFLQFEPLRQKFFE